MHIHYTYCIHGLSPKNPMHLLSYTHMCQQNQIQNAALQQSWYICAQVHTSIQYITERENKNIFQINDNRTVGSDQCPIVPAIPCHLSLHQRPTEPAILCQTCLYSDTESILLNRVLSHLQSLSLAIVLI